MIDTPPLVAAPATRAPALGFLIRGAGSPLGGFAQVTVALVLLAFAPILKENYDVFVVIIPQVIGAGVRSIINYFFGSSKDAAEVRAQLGQALGKLLDAGQ